MASSDTVRLLRLAGFGIWGLVGLPLLVRLGQAPQLLSQARYWLWLACFLVFGASFAWTAWRETPALGRPFRLASLAIRAVTALAMIGLVCTGQEGGLLVIVAAEIGWLLPLRRAMLWVIGQAAVMSVLLVTAWPAEISLMLLTTYFGFQLLAVVSCFLTARESVARNQLAQANRELRATRELLANTSRLAERERISRELHDTLGHHLTALSLNLEAAAHVSSGRALDQIAMAQSVSQLLLSDVRQVVAALRGEDPLGLEHALRTLVDAVPEPRIHLLLDDGLAVNDPVRAHTVLRCVQEVVTNAIRHAGAANLWIELTHSDGQLVIRARDDGRGASALRPGHGLTGMRERVEAVGGRLAIATEPSAGFRVEASIPLIGELA